MQPSEEVAAPPWGRSPAAKRASPRPALTPERIADAALAIIDAEGTEAVSMRRVAGDLGVVASSLYVHVRNRDELLGLVAERVEADVPRPQRTGDWKADLRAYAIRRHAILEAHGDIAALTFGTIPATPSAMENMEVLLGLLLDAGMSPEVASWGLERLDLYVTADALEGWHFAKRHPGGPEDIVRAVSDYFASMSTSRLPRLVEHHRVLVEGSGEERFRMGLDLIIAGMEQLGINAARSS